MSVQGFGKANEYEDAQLDLKKQVMCYGML